MSDYNGKAPTDRYNLAYCFLLLHGIGFLLPWNVFINAREYFLDYKFNATNADYKINFMSYLGFAAHFPTLCFAAWNTFFQKPSGQSNAVYRFAVAMAIEIFVLLFHVVMTMVDTSAIPEVFFILTIISVVLINCCVGIHQTLTFGMAAVLPMKYSNAVIVGSNGCGTMISLVNILTKWLSTVHGHSPRSITLAAIAYFLSAITIVLACVITFFWLRRLKFFRYYANLGNKRSVEVSPNSNGTCDPEIIENRIEQCTRMKDNSSSDNQGIEVCIPNGPDGEQPTSMDLKQLSTSNANQTFPMDKEETDALLQFRRSSFSGTVTRNIHPDNMNVFRNCFGLCCFSWPTGIQRCRSYWSRYTTCLKECWPHCLSIWSIFFCSLSVFPALQSMIKPVDENYFIPPRWFVDVTCFLFFNLFAMLGCIVCTWIQFPRPRYLWIPVWIRTCFFIPFFLFCNFGSAEPKVPVLITNDHLYVLAAVVFAFTNGYLVSLGMMYAPRSCSPQCAELGGMLAAFSLILGVCSGVYTSRALVSLIV